MKVVDNSLAPAGNGLFRGPEYIGPDSLGSWDIPAILPFDAERPDKGNRRLAFMALGAGGSELVKRTAFADARSIPAS